MPDPYLINPFFYLGINCARFSIKFSILLIRDCILDLCLLAMTDDPYIGRLGTIFLAEINIDT